MTNHRTRRPTGAALGAALLLMGAATGCAGGTSTPAAAATSNTTLTSAVAPAPVVRLSGPPTIGSTVVATPTVTATTTPPPPNRPAPPTGSTRTPTPSTSPVMAKTIPTRTPSPSSSPLAPISSTPPSLPAPSPSAVRLPHPSPPAPTGATAPRVVVNAAAESVAKAWLIGYRQATWTQPATAWISRVKPDVTDRLYRSYLPLVGRGGGAEWTRFVAGKCTSTVTDTGAVIPPEAPHTPSMVHVQVAGLLHSACTTGTPPADEPLAATLTVIATATGWRVDAREY